jgi:hypothetical protein
MKWITVCLSLLCLISCHNPSHTPDISHINVTLKVERFEKDLFALDTNNLQSGLFQLQKKYPDFLPLYINHVLGLGPLIDSNELAFSGTKMFLRLNRKPYDYSLKMYDNFNETEKELTEAFRYCKYYFPDYPIPNILTTVGPLDALAPMSNMEPSPNFMGHGFIAIGLQFYLGKDFEIYKDPDYISQIAPAYRSRRFSKAYIVSDVMKLVIDDLFPDSSSRLPLAEQMIERGKRMIILKKLLPYTHDTILTGYTTAQWEWANENERSIYNYFTQTDLLYERDPILIRPYLTDGPFTQALGENSPGNIGTFLGKNIVESFLANQKEKTDLIQMMKTPAAKILQESRYKPK